MDLSEEKELVERARKDPEAFGKIYDQYYSPIFNYVLRRIANIEIAQDITSEVFFRALKNLGKFRWQNISISFWLYRIATNQITDCFRKNNHKTISLEEVRELAANFDPPSDFPEAEEELIRHEDFLLLHENIAKLSIKYQEVIVLRFFEDKQIKDIARILGKREGTVKALLHRGLEKLRKLME